MAVLLYKWLFLFVLPLASLSTGSGKAHPFYVSVTEIQHNPQTKALEVSCKVFADDMEEVLKQQFKTKVDLTNTAQQAANDRYIREYVASRLGLSADGRALRLSYVGFEKESESVYCYFEVPDVAVPKKLDVAISLLHDLTPQQINIMHVTVNGARKSYKLDHPNRTASFAF